MAGREDDPSAGEEGRLRKASSLRPDAGSCIIISAKLQEVRCPTCNRLLLKQEASGLIEIMCRCGAKNLIRLPERQPERQQQEGP